MGPLTASFETGPWPGPSIESPRSAAPPGRSRILLDHRVRRGDQARHLDQLAIDHGGNPRRDLVLPVVALVHGVVEALALLLVLEAADPHVDALVLLAHEAAENDHAHLHLERDDLLLHALDPVVTLSRVDVILPELVEHAASLARAPGPAARRGIG